MSLTEETRTNLINLYLEKAYSTLTDAEGAVSLNAWGMAANRLYYAMFHATTALLVRDGIPVGSHRGIKALFGQNYILQGKFTSEHSKFWHKWKLSAIKQTITSCSLPVRRM